MVIVSPNGTSRTANSTSCCRVVLAAPVVDDRTFAAGVDGLDCGRLRSDTVPDEACCVMTGRRTGAEYGLRSGAAAVEPAVVFVR